jgi:hypothetical protein
MYERCIKWSGFFGRTIWLIGLIVAASTSAAAESLPVKIFTTADGLGEFRVSSIFESRSGELAVMTIFSSERPLSWFEGKRFRAIRPRLPH